MIYMSIINVCNLFHTGDNIINFIFFYKIKKYIEENNIIINYYTHDKHHKNLLDFKCSNNINICNITLVEFINGNNIYNIIRTVTINNIQTVIYHLWQATTNIPKEQASQEDLLCSMFNLFLQHYNIPITVNAFEYQDDDLFYRYSLLEEKYKNLDILIVNSTPLSNQYRYDKCEWDDFIIRLSKKYKVAITEKINNTNENIFCLTHFSLKQIAVVALGVQKIIAINTGPSIPLYNTDILNKVDLIYLFGGKGCIPTGPVKTRKIKEVLNLNELEFLIEK